MILNDYLPNYDTFSFCLSNHIINQTVKYDFPLPPDASPRLGRNKAPLSLSIYLLFL